jgi:hypothetical protein
MSYVWNTQGPAFEFPTCYRTENRILTLRAAVLILCAVAMLWLALSDPEPASPGAAMLRTPTERGTVLPYVLVALLLMGLGVFDLVTVARQRRVLLAPGQPASLVKDLSRQATGVSSGARWLMQLLTSGTLPPSELGGRYRRPLLAVSPRVAVAPTSLQEYLRERLAHLLFGAGLLVALVPIWALMPGAPALSLVGLLFSALAAALAARSAWIAKAAPSPTALLVVLAASALCGGLVAAFGGAVPHVARFQPLGIPMATLVVLGCLLLIDGLGLLAGREQVGKPAQLKVSGAEATATLVAEPGLLMHEVERELHRYWAEGVPNRRHAWEPLPKEATATTAALAAVVLEESQPLLPAEHRDRRAAPPRAHHWLLALDLLGLVLTLLGAGLWVRLSYGQMQGAVSNWASGSAGLVLVVAGAYAIRVAHLLWSRVEVDSTVFWVDVAGVPADAAALAASGAALSLRVRVLQARSVFYAAAEHVAGSRTLLRLTPDGLGAQRFVKQVQAYAERLSPAGVSGAAVGSPSAVMTAPAPRPPRAPAPPASAAPFSRGQPPARFCPACGTQVVPGARFCQHCGAGLPS